MFADKRALSGPAAAVIIVLILVVAVFAYISYVTPQPAQQIPSITPSAPSKGVRTGTLYVVDSGYDSLDTTTTRASGTNYKVTWYYYRNGQWIAGPTGQGSTPVSLDVTELDNNYVYAVVTIPSGQSYYVDANKIKSMNSRCDAVLYQDVTGDLVEDFIFRINIADVPVNEKGYIDPDYRMNFYVYLLSYEAPSLTAPSALTGIGTSKVTKFSEFYATFTNTKRAVALCKVEVKYNTTDVTKVTLKNVNIPGLGNIPGTSFTMSKDGTYTYYTYNIGNNLNSALYVTYGTNQPNKFDFTVTHEFLLSSGDTIQCTLTLYFMTPTSSWTTVSASQNISA